MTLASPLSLAATAAVGAPFLTSVAGSGRLPPDALACLHHGEPPPDADPRRLRLPLPRLHGPAAELWSAGRPVLAAGSEQGLHWAHDGQQLFAHLSVAAEDVIAASEDVYWRLERLVVHHGFPYWLRTWNYLAGINAGEGDGERYRQFCLGRGQALAARSDFERHLPAATAIGSAEPGLVVAVLAGRKPGVALENPRQVAAFRYPRQYGPRSPSFTRAMLLRDESGAGAAARLLVSGTASIVGHATRHAGDVLAQLDEAAVNVEALLRHAAVSHFPDVGEPMWTPESFKVYLRHAEHAEAVRAAFERRLAHGLPWTLLQGDICRQDLLVELEAVYRWDGPG
ncbi:hypothetical protein [Stagnimonas aquatica]|uniref:chorismate transformation enzyme, FkbO/Hyg5 family n=1 Tax=Stagnimonas aquatica TaxID=2689987 RepID=UPI0011CD4955|nr:hypothetical protein [Stagnimonas aquatica]